MNKWISNRYIKILVILLCIALIFSFRYIVNASDYSQSEDVQVNIIDREAGINSTVSAVGDDSQSDTVAAEISQSVEDLEQEPSTHSVKKLSIGNGRRDYTTRQQIVA